MQFDHSQDIIDPDITEVLTIKGTGGLEIPLGTSSQRPGGPQGGTLRFNTETDSLEWSTNSQTWTTAQVGYTGSIGYTGSASTEIGYTGSKGDTGYTGSASTIVGPIGYTGSQGGLGYTGSVGFTGSQGNIGYTGSASTVSGPIGYTGSQGGLGYTGSIGFTGSQGGVGYTGSAGTAGAMSVLILTDASSELVSGTYTLDGTYTTILVNTTSAINIQLTSSTTNRRFEIKMIGSYGFTVLAPTGGGTLDGSSSSSVSVQYTSISIFTPGSGAWYLI